MPIEINILDSIIELTGEGADAYGFALAQRIAQREGETGLIAHGTLYKALARMTGGGLLESWWEDPSSPEAGGRPARRLYRVTGVGEVAVQRAHAAVTAPAHAPKLALS